MIELKNKKILPMSLSILTEKFSSFNVLFGIFMFWYFLVDPLVMSVL